MNIRFKGRSAFAICATVTFLTSCGALLSPATKDSVNTATSFVSPAAVSQDLLYISDLGADSVDMYTYPSGKLVGELHDFGSVAGLCSDKAGNVFVVDEAGPVQEFAHAGTSPIRSLATTGAPYGCAVDPTTGNLALTNLSSVLYGAIAVYPNAKGKPKEYQDSSIDSTFFCGYDSSGNLFASAWDRSANPILVTLPKKRGVLGYYKLDKKNKNPSGVQWDGKYVAVGGRGNGLIYRVNGATGASEGTVTLHGGANIEQFWIQGKTLIGPNATSGGAVAYWRYPAGGSPTETLSGFSYPFGSTVSFAKKPQPLATK